MHIQKSFPHKPSLFLVATPIGNLSEMSQRTIDTLNMVDIIACEDTRVSAKILKYLNLKKPLIACHEHNERSVSPQLLEEVISGRSVAYMSDAGFPGISDPGVLLVQTMLDHHIPVIVISGPSAMLNALVASGLPTDTFTFVGFLPTKAGQKLDLLRSYYSRKETLIFYESPHRIMQTLQHMSEVFSNRRVCLARELTKLHETYIRGTIQELLQLDPATLKGEMVLIVEGNKEEMSLKLEDEDIRQLVNQFMSTGLSMKDAIRQASLLSGKHKNYIYQLMHRF